MKKPGLSFYTNIPTPYQLSFFSELAKLFELKIIYYAATEANRQWNFALQEDYQVIVLKNNFIARFFQHWIVDFHFSWQIFSVAFKDKNENIIVGGGYWIPNSVIALVWHKLKRRKIAYFSEPLFAAKNKLVFLIKWLCLRVLNICCQAIFCIGKKAAESFEGFGVRIPKFIILYNIDPAPFQLLNSDTFSRYKARLKPDSEIIILSSGSLIERKGMDILIKAFKQIDLSTVRLLIIGEGPYRNHLQELAGNDKRIVFAGFQTPEQIPYFFAIADIFAFASRYDGWGVVINEAIAAQLPIVSSDKVGAAVELISGTGILCPSEDVATFKMAMESLVFNAGKRQRIKENMQQLVPLISSSYNARQVYDIFLHQLN